MSKKKLRSRPLIWKCVLPTSSFSCKSESFPYERFYTKTRFETEAQGNSEVTPIELIQFVLPVVNSGLVSSASFSTAIVKNIIGLIQDTTGKYKNNSLLLAGKYARTISRGHYLPVLRGENFSESVARGKLWALRNRQFPRTNIRAHFRAKWRLLCFFFFQTFFATRAVMATGEYDSFS